mgnify:CR=1 FL=1
MNGPLAFFLHVRLGFCWPSIMEWRKKQNLQNVYLAIAFLNWNFKMQICYWGIFLGQSVQWSYKKDCFWFFLYWRISSNLFLNINAYNWVLNLGLFIFNSFVDINQTLSGLKLEEQKYSSWKIKGQKITGKFL